MSQNYSRGLENEYLVPYLEFTENPSTGSIAGGGTTSLTAVATASTGIGYMKYRWYQDDVLKGGITTALSGVSTSRDFTLAFSGDDRTKNYSYKVSAEWVPENSDIIVSHGTPGVGATGVGVGQSISGYSPNGETFSSVGITSVSPAITVGIVTVSDQPLGYNTSAYNQSRTLSVEAIIQNGNTGGLTYQWKSGIGQTVTIAGATSSSYTFTPGYVGLTTYACVVSYPSDELVVPVTSDIITDNSTDTTQTIRLEFFPAGGELSSSSSTYKVYSTEVNLSDHPNGLKIDQDYARSIITSQNTSTYAWDNYYYLSFYAKDDDLTVDLELSGANGIDANGNRGGYGGWMVLQGTMGHNKEFVGVAATGQNNDQKPATAVYQLGSVIGISGNGGGAASQARGGDGGADSAGENSGANAGGIYYQPNTLMTEGFLPPSGVLAAGRASRCPKGSSYFQNRYGACETFQSNIRDPDGVDYPEGAGDQLTIDRGFKVTNTYLINGEQTSNPLATGKGGSGAMGGNGDIDVGGGGGSGYYGGNWTKLANVRGGNDGSSRTWTYGTGLTQTVTTDGKNGYIRIFGRGGSSGNNPIVTNRTARIHRGSYPEQGNYNGLWLDLADWPDTMDVSVRSLVTVNSSGHFITLYLTDGTNTSYSYALRGDSDTNRGGVGTIVLTAAENSGDGYTWVRGGNRYQFRTHDHSAGSSGVYKGGEDMGGGAGIASQGDFDITVHDAGASGGDNNQGANADLRVQFSIAGERNR
jgi:hypothetical protein